MSNTKHTPEEYVPQPLPEIDEILIEEMWFALAENTNDPGYEFAYKQATETEKKIRENWAAAEKIRAAAPELLDALETLVRVLEYDPDLMQHFPMDMAYAAIKKATK